MPNKKIRDCFIENLKKLMNLHKLSQVELAEQIGVAKTSISMWLSGNAFPRDEILDKLADYFKISVSELLNDKENEPLTIAAHFDGDEYTEEELEEIKQFAEFVKAKRK